MFFWGEKMKQSTVVRNNRSCDEKTVEYRNYFIFKMRLNAIKTKKGRILAVFIWRPDTNCSFVMLSSSREPSHMIGKVGHGTCALKFELSLLFKNSPRTLLILADFLPPKFAQTSRNRIAARTPTEEITRLKCDQLV